MTQPFAGARSGTETRIAATDARRTFANDFAKYRRVIDPGSAIIRSVWLDAVTHLAER